MNQAGDMVDDNDRHLLMEPEVISVVPCASCLSLSVCVCVNEGGLRESEGKIPGSREV